MTKQFNSSWLQPSYEDIHNACYEAVQTFKTYGFEFKRILGIARGGMLPAMILSHMLEIPVSPISYSSKSGKGDDRNHTNQIVLTQDSPLLLVDDICDSGNTLYELKHLYENAGVSTYSFVLYYKSRSVPVYIPDFKWRSIPEDADWVIFPYEKKERVGVELKRSATLHALGRDL